MLLEDKDKERFILWLEQTAETSKGIAKEMEKMPGHVMNILIQREKIVADACIVIIKLLSKDCLKKE